MAAPKTTKYSEVDEHRRDDALHQRAPRARHLEAEDGLDGVEVHGASVLPLRRWTPTDGLTKMSSSELCAVCRSLKSMPARPGAAAARRCPNGRAARRSCRPGLPRRPDSSGRIRPSVRAVRASGACRCSVSCFLPSLLHQPRLVLDQDDLALADDADALGHFLGLLDVVRGQDDGHAGWTAGRAPSATCRGATRRRRRRWARPGTGSAARGSAPWRSSRGASCRPTACRSSRPSCPTATARAAPFSTCAGSGALPNRPRLKLTVFQTRLEGVGGQLLRHQADLRSRGAVVAQDVVAVHRHAAAARR